MTNANTQADSAAAGTSPDPQATIALAGSDHPLTFPSRSNPSLTLPNGPDPAQNLSALLDRLLRITIKDERYFIGRFVCTDPKLNIVLSHAEEFRPGPKTDQEQVIREHKDRYYPKSQRADWEYNYAKWGKAGDGYGDEAPHRDGRILSMIMIPGREVVSVELLDEGGSASAGVV